MFLDFVVKQSHYLNMIMVWVQNHPNFQWNKISDHLNMKGKLIADPSQYRRLIGRFLYPTLTRPDITYVVHRLSQFLAQPREPHMLAVNKVLQYIKGSTGKWIFFPSEFDLQIKSFCDPDWAGCPDTRRSLTGYSVFLEEASVSWRSIKQGVVSSPQLKPSIELWLVWLVKLHGYCSWLKTWQLSHSKPALMFCDNQAALRIARTKHIKVDCYLVRYKIQEGVCQNFSCS